MMSCDRLISTSELISQRFKIGRYFTHFGIKFKLKGVKQHISKARKWDGSLSVEALHLQFWDTLLRQG